jgi:tetratricopeptide (TPR) repeat protein
VNYRRAAFIGLCLLFGSNTAFADAKQDAQKRFKNGKELMRLEDFSGAAAELEQSVSLFPTKNGLFNLANCYKALHRYSEALNAYGRLQSEFGDKLDREMSSLVTDDMEQIRGLVGQVEIRVNRPSAELYIDDQRVGQSPLDSPLLLGPGEHTIKVTLEGYQEAEQKVQVVSGEKNTIAITLQVVKASQEAEPQEKGLLDQTPVAAAQPEQRSNADEDSPPRLYPYAWATGGLALITGGTAIVFWVLGNGQHSDWDAARKTRPASYTLDNFKNDAELNDYEDNARLDGKLAIGFGIAAGVFAVATVALFVIDASLQGEREEDALWITPGQLRLRF